MAGPHVLGRPERRRARLHVDVRGEAAVDHRRAGPDGLGQDHACQRFSVLLGQGARQGDRRHRTGQRERRDTDGLVVGGELHDPLEHRGIEPERRARVDDREDRRLAIELLGVDAARDADHLEGVDVALPAEAVGVDRLVHQGQGVERRVEVPDAVVQVDGLDRVAGQEMDRVERLAQAQQVLVVDPVADPPAAVEVGHVGRAADRPEGDPVATQLQVVLGIPGMQGEGRGRGQDQLGDHRRVEPDTQRAFLGLGAGPPQDLARVGIEEVHADLGQHAQGAEVDRLQLVGRDDLRRPVAHPWLGPRRLLWRRVAGMTLPAAATTAPKTFARGRVHVRHANPPNRCCACSGRG